MPTFCRSAKFNTYTPAPVNCSSEREGEHFSDALVNREQEAFLVRDERRRLCEGDENDLECHHFSRGRVGVFRVFWAKGLAVNLRAFGFFVL